MAARLKAIGERGRAYRMANCADTIISDVCGKCEKREIIDVRRCRDRLCPICAWRRSITLSKKLVEVIETNPQKDDHKYIALTLAVKNVPWTELDKEIERIIYGWKKLQQRLRRAGTITGWARVLDVSRAKDAKTAHPHLHCILQTPKKYHEREPCIFKPAWQPELIRQWQDSLRVDYEPSVYVRTIGEGAGMKVAVNHAAKYITKATNIDGIGDEEFTHYVNAVRHVKTWATGGEMRVNEKDIESEETQKADDTCNDCGGHIYEMREAWSTEKLEYVIKVDLDYNKQRSENYAQKTKAESGAEMGNTVEAETCEGRPVEVNISNSGEGNVYVSIGVCGKNPAGSERATAQG